MAVLITCEKCDGSHCKDNEKCFYGMVEAPKNMKFYVNVYRITRHFGGHEEGGWYYNRAECLETVPVKSQYAEEIQEDLFKQYEHLNSGDIYSVSGGTLIDVRVEEKIKESEYLERPMYE